MTENTRKQNEILGVRGRIFDIQKFSVHDGPGIRTIVFLKGCRLRCRWCCNPESQSYEIETMMQNGKEKTVGYDTTVGEVLKTVLQDMPYYRRSGGGVTLSGGECLCQPEFSLALLTACKAYGLSTAIETTCIADWDVISRFVPVTDTFLMDIKHMDSEKHREFTTQPNEKILANALRLSKETDRLIVRVPVIPGFNDTEEEIRAIAEFASWGLHVGEMHILPYHRLGYDKYIGLGRTYGMGSVPPPEKSKMEFLRDVCTSVGITCHIGG